MRSLLAVIASSLFALSAPADLRELTGRYEQSDGALVYVTLDAGALVLRPVFWRSPQLLVPDGGDAFHASERTERKASFARDENGHVVSLTVNGIGHDAPMKRVEHDRPLPPELLMRGRPREAARALLARRDAPAIAVKWGSFIERALPTMAADGAGFVGEVVRRYPRDAALQSTHGALLVASGRRSDARRAFERALAIDAGNEDAARALRMLGGNDLGPLFARPDQEELAAVEAAWSKRDLEPRDVRVVARGRMDLGHAPAEVRIVSHRVHGLLHYGAVIVPDGAARAAVVVEAKGVSPSYFPLDLSRVPLAPEMMGDAQKDFVYFLPSYRGEVLRFGGNEWTSEGDRTDVWDGATDDFIAFTAAALGVTPEADASRVCAFGKSRGGSVALLAGIRDRTFDCVVAWSAPSDHLFEMVQSGWTPRERAAEGLRAGSDVFGIGGQFIETFLAKKRPVAATRLHLLASSPAWFARRLPPTQAHYGEDDNIVSTRNGRALAAANPRVEVVLHPEAGHDLDAKKAFRESKRFLLEHLRPR